MRLVAILLLAASWCGRAVAEDSPPPGNWLEAPLVACTTTWAVDEYLQAAFKEDIRHIRALLEEGSCIWLSLPFEFSLLEIDGDRARILLYGETVTARLWIPTLSLPDHCRDGDC